MNKNKINLKNVVAIAICFVGLTVFSGCKKDKDDGIYPLTEYEFLHLGNKSGLTSSSSDQAFRNGLNEVLQTWSENNPSTGEVIIDGVAYELTNIQEAAGAIPNYIWDIFWGKLEEYSYSIGSCWGFSEVKIPSKGVAGTAYILYTIVTHLRGEVLYIALKCNVTPKSSSKSQSAEIYQLDNVEKVNELFKSVNVERKNK
jgi:hypothetical protein